jgi:hypothetical protein
MMIRSDPQPLQIPLAANSAAKLSSGQRSLALAWTGGAPPYQVRLQREGQEGLVLEANHIDQTRFRSKPVELSPGAYRLTVSGASRKGVNLSVLNVMVVPADQLPKAPTTLLSPAQPDSLRETVYPAWLASQGQEWALEAYQRALPWLDEHEPAQWLMYCLEKGVRPPPP